MPETIPTTPAPCSADTDDPQAVDELLHSSSATCPECAHPECRTQRAAHQSRVRGHTAEFTAEHRKAAAVQASHTGIVVWFGESTQSYWAATPTGLTEASDSDTLLVVLCNDGNDGNDAADPAPTAGAERGDTDSVAEGPCATVTDTVTDEATDATAPTESAPEPAGVNGDILGDSAATGPANATDALRLGPPQTAMVAAGWAMADALPA